MKKILELMFYSLAIFMLVFWMTASQINAASPKPLPSPSPKAIEEVNSFELFWPLVAGKTSDESLYFLKSLKEKVRYLLIFSPARKADYSLFLATKRLLEYEKLLTGTKIDASQDALSLALVEFTQVEKNLSLASSNSESLGDLRNSMMNRLKNLDTFLKWLVSKEGMDKSKLEEIFAKVQLLSKQLE